LTIIASQKDRGVLIVDDDPGVRHALSARLKQEGFTKIFSAEDGLRALTCLELEGASIYVIVTDVVMPAMDGIKLAEFLTSNYHQPTGIIYMSGFAERKTEFQVGDFSEGDILNFDFFAKPFSMVELINRVIQCGDLVFNRRISLSRYSIENLSQRLEELNDKISSVASDIQEITIQYKGHNSFLKGIGFEIVKTVIIALFIIVTIKGIGFSKLISIIQ
tara:strand:+ start:466 stop:1122 length:657 start_codon:yes stop_codon:yes gene_type:complete